MAEDVGRHNAVDKVCGGRCCKVWTPDRVLLSTGRVSSEMLLKGRTHGHAGGRLTHLPTEMAISIAEQLG